MHRSCSAPALRLLFLLCLLCFVTFFLAHMARGRKKGGCCQVWVTLGVTQLTWLVCLIMVILGALEAIDHPTHRFLDVFKDSDDVECKAATRMLAAVCCELTLRSQPFVLVRVMAGEKGKGDENTEESVTTKRLSSLIRTIEQVG